jgi:hypothetical protein
MAGCGAQPAANEYDILSIQGSSSQGATATASSTKSSYFPAAHAVDGKPTTAWAPAPGDKHPSLVICLDRPTDINGIVIKLSHQSHSTAPITVKVEVDGGSGFAAAGHCTPALGREVTPGFASQYGVRKIRLCFDTSDLYVCEVCPVKCPRPARQPVIFSYGGLPPNDSSSDASSNGTFLTPGDPAGATPTSALRLGADNNGVGEAIFLFGDFPGAPTVSGKQPPRFDAIQAVTVRANPDVGSTQVQDGAPRFIFYLDGNNNGNYDDQTTDPIIFGTDQAFDTATPGVYTTIDFSTFNFNRNTSATLLTLAQVRAMYGNLPTLGVSILVDAPGVSPRFDEFTVKINGKQPLIAGEPGDAPTPRGGL